MQRFQGMFAIGMVLAAAAPVEGQIVGGVMSVTQSHMS
jgi:hypothetical protein